MPQCESLHYALAIEPGHQYVSGQTPDVEAPRE